MTPIKIPKMKIHVTCGRGTEPFVKAELHDKLRCQEIDVEDGKVFFKLADITDTDSSSADHLEQLFQLKTVERIFITVAHFPTSDIKGNGKVKFLQLLKDRILNSTDLKKAVENSQKLQRMQKLCKEQLSDGCNHKRFAEDADINTADINVPTVSPLLSECKKSVKEQHFIFTSNNRDSKDNQPKHSVVQDNQPCDNHVQGDVIQTDKQCSNFKNDTMISVNKLQSNPVIALGSGRAFDDQRTNSLCYKHRAKRSHTTVSRDQTDSEDIDIGRVCELKDKRFQEPLGKKRRCEYTYVSGSGCYKDSCMRLCSEEMCKTNKEREPSSTADCQKRETTAARSFRFSVKCGGWCKKWLQPQRLAKELGIRLTIMTGWTVDLCTPDVEICVHANDDFVTVGIPLTRVPLSRRDYILDAGLRSTISWIIAQLADIQPGHCVLDPMCGKATVLVEAAREHSQATKFLGCDLDSDQLETAHRNVKHAELHPLVQLIQANALNLPLRSGCVNRIVCDAPFGQKFTVKSCSLSQFYSDFMREMYRLLVPEGLVVLLTSEDLLPVVKENCHASRYMEPASHADYTNIVPDEANSDLNSIGESFPGETSTSVLPTLRTSAVPENQERSTSNVNSHTSSSLRDKSEESVTDLVEVKYDCNDRFKAMVDDQKSVVHHSETTVNVDQQSIKQTIISGESLKKDTEVTGQFSFISSHYVKLGETHAYIVVLQKSANDALSC